MNKLKYKIFFTILSIFTFCILTIIIIFNCHNYYIYKNKIINNLYSFNNHQDYPHDNLLGRDIYFLDSSIYTILLDDDNQIIDIINHSSESINQDELEDIANKVLKENKEIKIGNLYFNRYSYKYQNGKYIIISDNQNTQETLYNYLYLSLLIFLLLEIIIAIISLLITKWLLIPIQNMLNKQKEFIEDASHELKTPLSIIIASCDTLEAKKTNKWLKNIQKEADRMSKLIQDLLHLAESEKENLFNFQVGNFSKTIELEILSFEALAFEKNITLKYEILENINFKYDEEKIQELLNILLDNALCHTINNHDINIILKQEANNIILEITNYGNPIPKGEEEKIFERFYRLDKSRNRNENRYGLGLAIAKNIVLSHQGTIKAFSKGNLTTFQIVFKK